MKKILILAIVAIMALPVVADDSSKNADGKARNSDRMTQLFNAKVKMMKEKLRMMFMNMVMMLLRNLLNMNLKLKTLKKHLNNKLRKLLRIWKTMENLKNII